MKRNDFILYILLGAVVGLLTAAMVKLTQIERRINKIGALFFGNPTSNVSTLPRDLVIDEGDSYAIGPADAPNTVIAFFDYDCFYCKQFFENTFPAVKEQLIDSGNLRFVFRHLPIAFHENAFIAAQMAEHARKQDKFPEVHNRMMLEGLLNREFLLRMAQELSMDTTGCFTDSQAIAKINADMALCDSAGISGTPAFVINGKLYTGACEFAEFQRLIESGGVLSSEKSCK